MKKLILSLFVLLCMSAFAIAQNRTVSGTVTSQGDNMPIPGVSVKIVGAAGGAITSSDGKYSISIPSGATALQFSFIGYTSQNRPITSSSVINVVLADDSKGLNEVVVVGYGTQVRKDITGSVGSVKGEAIKNLASPSFDKQLAGQVTGVQASTTSGILGQPARIRIRGTNSISSSGDPLYVVDGVPYIAGDQGAVTQYNPLADINPNDIESYDVLKDGAATAIYGSRASNGVILITTKRGKSGAAKITYDSWFALATPSKRYDLLNADQFIEISNEKYAYYGEKPIAFPTVNADGSAVNTDWQKEILRNGFQQSHALTVSGATEQTNYFLSLGYANLTGTTVNNDMRKYNFRTKIEQKAFNNRLTLGVNTAITYTKNNGLNDGAGSAALSGNIASAIRALPNVPVKNADGSYNLSADQTVLGPGANTKTIDDNYPNIAYVLANNIYSSQALNLTGNAFAKLKIIEGLNATTQIGINYLHGEDYLYWNPTHGDGRGSNGIVDQFYSPTFRYNWQNTLDYSKTFGDHKLDVVAGLEFQKTRQRFIEAQGTNLSAAYFAKNGNIISNTLANQFYGGGSYESAYASVFGRVSYSYLDKYLLSASIRRDKISDLPIGNQDVSLPGASVGWRISKENFFAESDALKFINDLKLRGGYAKVGNVEIGRLPGVGIFAPVQYGDVSGINFNRLGNPDLSFETSKKVNIGLDLTMFDNRISFSADYFKNNIDNLILAVPTPASYGVPSNRYSANVGSMNNKGWEFSATSTNIRNTNFSWTTNLNVTFVKNKITALADGNADLINTYNITRVGESIGAFYGYEAAGVNPANGNPLFYKENGSIVQPNVDDYEWYAYDPANPSDMSKSGEALTGKDKRILGQANPTWFGGLNNTFTYKSLDLGIMLTFSGGNKIYNVTRQEALNTTKFLNNGVEIMNRWTTPGQITDVPKVSYSDDGLILQTGNLNSRFLEDGKFLRAQNISLGYTFSPKFLTKLQITNLRIYAQVQNAFVITKYTGLDPELATGYSTTASENRAPGVDYNTNPVPRTYTMGINLGF
ncbi:SusC/RagA family TonB-linked outer membrane protein [Pedobacter antarcticus]|uniref:SusC/RagA family TonB-linked outer membrane protein n=1 Tax=Pedobacter antarcticus TaxID=34086 RepID=UPI00088DB974|nr:TonB-dependent receptor [Pedobacter antarcticus]SDM75295.1 TonB-linked outer membrane protein, SusC/RagA family [Pedobacter antarcticus]